MDTDSDQGRRTRPAQRSGPTSIHTTPDEGTVTAKDADEREGVWQSRTGNVGCELARNDARQARSLQLSVF